MLKRTKGKPIIEKTVKSRENKTVCVCVYCMYERLNFLVSLQNVCICVDLGKMLLMSNNTHFILDGLLNCNNSNHIS